MAAETSVTTDVTSFLVLCEVPRGMCSSSASYAHPGKEEVHRQASCGGGESRLTFKDFGPLRVNSITNYNILAETSRVICSKIFLINGQQRVKTDRHTEEWSSYSHMFYRVSGGGSLFLFRETVVKHNGFCVGQAKSVGPHDFYEKFSVLDQL